MPVRQSVLERQRNRRHFMTTYVETWTHGRHQARHALQLPQTPSAGKSHPWPSKGSLKQASLVYRILTDGDMLQVKNGSNSIWVKIEHPIHLLTKCTASQKRLLPEPIKFYSKSELKHSMLPVLPHTCIVLKLKYCEFCCCCCCC